jgi:type VI secretion system protein ImpC
MDAPRDLAKIIVGPQYHLWRHFRSTEESRFVGLCLPRFLGRAPYGKDASVAKGFDYQERCDSQESALWINSAYALVTRVIDSFVRVGLCSDILGTPGGVVPDLPAHMFWPDSPSMSVESWMAVRRVFEFASLGFIPLLQNPGIGGKGPAFSMVQSVRQPHSGGGASEISARIPFLMICCRFVHYLRAMMRETIGAFITPAEAAVFFSRWIAAYLSSDDTRSPITDPRGPLREARFVVTEIPGRRGAYKVTAFLRPGVPWSDYAAQQAQNEPHENLSVRLVFGFGPEWDAGLLALFK